AARETRAPRIRETRARRGARPGCASTRAFSCWKSSMTCRAIGWRLDVIPLRQFFAVLHGITGSRPSHVGHLIRRTQMDFRGPMAVQAPAHAERLVLVHLDHLVHPAVA